MFVHRVLAEFDECILPVHDRAVLVLLVGVLGGIGVAGFLAERSFLSLAVWHVRNSAHWVRGPSATVARLERGIWVTSGEGGSSVGLSVSLG